MSLRPKIERFQSRVQTSLSRYREQTLGIAESGSWRGKQYGHILPPHLSYANILPSVRASFVKSTVSAVKKHVFFHHLNSSQALCFNLFYPLIQSPQGLNLLVEALGIDGVPAANSYFEYSPNAGESTSVDFMLPLSSGARILIEVKYTETEFGSARHTDKYVRQFEHVYQPRFNGQFEPHFEKCEIFLQHYQILRNIWSLRESSGDTVIFLIPRSNESLRQGIQVIEACMSAAYRNRVRIVYIEDLLFSLQQKIGSAPELSQSLLEFRQKYFTPEIVGLVHA